LLALIFLNSKTCEAISSTSNGPFENNLVQTPSSVPPQFKAVTRSDDVRSFHWIARKKKCDDSFISATTPEFRVLTDLFHEPLFDRTDTLKLKGVKAKILTPIPDFDVTLKNKSVAEVARNRAKYLWKRAGELPSRTMQIFFSGDIDSTAALTALLETYPSNAEAPKLIVKMASRAIEEYNLFYERYIAGGKVPVEFVDDKDDMCEFLDGTRLTVTGELGDQLFGSNTMARAVRSNDIDLNGPWTQESLWSAPLERVLWSQVLPLRDSQRSCRQRRQQALQV